ncbi:sigma-54 interaction domain-containing protein, partial [Calditrichota bacterium]
KVISSITPIKRQKNDIVSIVFVFRDTKEMESMVKSLQDKSIEILNEKNKLEAIFNSRSEGTFTIDNDWNITSFNRSAEKITGYPRQQAIGKKCWDIFQSRLCRNGCHMENTMSEKKLSVENELLIVRKDKNHLPIRVNSAPLFNSEGDCIGGVETFRDISEIKNLTAHLEERFKFENIIGRSKVMQKMYNLLENVAKTDSTVLVTGESGTGKELVARAIHLNSDRKTKPFIVVNCSAFAETLLESELFGHERGAFTGAIRTKQGHFELAQEGTLFLDEIGDISLPVQVKLLRVLESRQFTRVGATKQINMNVRIIAATNKNLYDEVKNGHFREDLFYRINIFNVHLPPLRDRMTDLPILLEHFLDKLKHKFKKGIQGIAPPAYKLLDKHQWPGNVRELENVLEHAFVLCQGKIIQSEHLPEWLWQNIDVVDTIDQSYDEKHALQDAEKTTLRKTLNKFTGHRGKTAAALGIDKSTLWRKMKKFDLL